MLLELPKLINKHRADNGLPAIPVVSEMTWVALFHGGDLNTYRPDVGCGGNLHSWSDNGFWTPGCFDLNDPSTYPVMWDKPKEITKYPERGYEISYIGSDDPEQAVNAWKASPPHNDVMLNKGIWSELTWQALGGTAGGQFATAWFGVAPGRPLGAPSEPSAAPKAEKGVGDAPPNPGTR